MGSGSHEASGSSGNPFVKILTKRVSKLGIKSNVLPPAPKPTTAVTEHAAKTGLTAAPAVLKRQASLPLNSVKSTKKKPSGKLVTTVCGPNYIADQFKIIQTIGEGAYAKVKLCMRTRSHEKVALKISMKAEMAAYIKKNYQREADLMWKLDHPNIVKLLEVIETDAYFILVLEHVPGEEILEYIVRNKRLSEKEAQKYTLQLIDALEHMHANGVVHRDLKTENIMLDSNRNIRVIDFGLSNQYSASGKLSTFCGSPVYAAPELIKGEPYTGPEVDVWSLGMIVYAMLAGRLPYSSSSMRRLLEKMVKGEFAILPEWSDACVKLIKAILVVPPEQRPTLAEVMNHPWVKKRSAEHQKEVLEAKVPHGSIDASKERPFIEARLPQVSIKLESIPNPQTIPSEGEPSVNKITVEARVEASAASPSERESGVNSRRDSFISNVSNISTSSRRSSAFTVDRNSVPGSRRSSSRYSSSGFTLQNSESKSSHQSRTNSTRMSTMEMRIAKELEEAAGVAGIKKQAEVSAEV